MEIVRALYQLVAIAIPYNIVLAALVVHDEIRYDNDDAAVITCNIVQWRSFTILYL